MATPIEGASRAELRELGLSESDMALSSMEPNKFRTAKASIGFAAIDALERYLKAAQRAEQVAYLDEVLPPPAPATASTRGRF